MAQAQQHEDHAWIGATLADALDVESPILRSYQAGDLPALNDIVDSFLVNEQHNHTDRAILLIANVYLLRADFLLRVDPETSDRATLVVACGELGRLGRWLTLNQAETLEGVRSLVAVAASILAARMNAPDSALAQGPAADLLILAGKGLS
jgi:hypothetical protein